MRINKFIASSSSLSRRAADEAIQAGHVTRNGQRANLTDIVVATDVILLDGKQLYAEPIKTIMLNKPVNIVVSRNGQGSKTIYDIIPMSLQHLQAVGRLDKASSGLLILTNDGALAQVLTHPSSHKLKIYNITLNQPLQPLHRQMINDYGISLSDGPSKLSLERKHDGDEHRWIVTMHEGRNRQIRRTFDALGYHVSRLHRTHFGPYTLGNLPTGAHKIITE